MDKKMFTSPWGFSIHDTEAVLYFFKCELTMILGAQDVLQITMVKEDHLHVKYSDHSPFCTNGFSTPSNTY
jgi:hypothetical protein